MRLNGRALVVVGLVLGTWWLTGSSGAWAALWPSVVALAAVLLLRKVVVGLALGGFCGAVLLVGGNPWTAFTSLFEVHLLPAFSSPWKTGAVLFTLVLGGFVSLIERGGGLYAAFAGLLRGPSRRRVEGAAGGLGLVCFFDGLANALMVGRLFSGLADQAGVSRAKLAYIVDTTSASVACVAMVSTWIAFQLAMIQEGLVLAGQGGNWAPYDLFLASLPLNFYCWFALVLLGVTIWRGWDFGPMARSRPNVIEADAAVGTATPAFTAPWRALLPLGVLLGLVLGGIYSDGVGRLELTLWPLTGAKLSAAFGAAEAAIVLVWASVVAAAVAALCYPRASAEGDAAGRPTAATAFAEGVHALLGPILILLASWVLSSVLGGLGAADHLGRLLSDRVPFALLPAAVFGVAALTSFTTGTSWGTMGLVMPLAVPLVFTLGPVDPELVRWGLGGVVAAVFSGAVFGDHCSPLSDTTIVASIACGIEPHEHVRTQLPYALLAAGVALVVGFLPLVWLPSGFLGLLVGTGLLVGLGWWATRRRAV